MLMKARYFTYLLVAIKYLQAPILCQDVGGNWYVISQAQRAIVMFMVFMDNYSIVPLEYMSSREGNFTEYLRQCGDIFDGNVWQESSKNAV